MIQNILDNNNVEQILVNIINRIHIDGPIVALDFEALAYIKRFHNDILQKYESKLLYSMGLFYKTREPESLLSEVYSIYEDIIKSETGRNFTPVQAHAYLNIKDKTYFSFSAPTSAGKSYLFREIIQDVDYDIVIVVPSRALITEYVNTVHNLLSHDTSILILPFIENINKSNTTRRIFIITPERGIELFKSIHEFNIGLFLLDEAQISEDGVRGMKFDSFIRRVDKHLPSAKKVFAHPFVNNPEAQLFKHNFKENSSSATYEQHTVGKIFLSLDNENLSYFSPYEENNINISDVNSDIASDILKKNGTVLIYLSKAKIYSGQYIIDFAKYIDMCDQLTNPNAIKLIEKLRKFIGASSSGKDKFSALISMMEKGIVLHHGSMPLNARLIMEDFVRLGFAHICFSTATLIQGINMPFDMVWIDNFHNLKTLNLKNLIGRAGRTTSHNHEFEFGYVIVKKENIATFSKRLKENYNLTETSIIDDNLSSVTNNDLKDIIEAVKDDTFNDDLNLTNTQVERLKNKDITKDIEYILDNMIVDSKPIKAKNYNNLTKHFKKKISNSIKNIFITHLRKDALNPGETGVLHSAIPILLWKIQGKSFSEILSLRYAYLSKKDERNSILAKVHTNEITAEDAKKIIQDIPVHFSPIPKPLPDDKLGNINRFAGVSIDRLNYDVLVYDTYDYLDKVISLSLADPLCAAFQLYYDDTKDRRALMMKNYIRYGTNNITEIWLLRYGFEFEDIDWLLEYIENINENEIIFNEKIHALEEEKLNIISRFI